MNSYSTKRSGNPVETTISAPYYDYRYQICFKLCSKSLVDSSFHPSWCGMDWRRLSSAEFPPHSAKSLGNSVNNATTHTHTPRVCFLSGLLGPPVTWILGRRGGSIYFYRCIYTYTYMYTCVHIYIYRHMYVCLSVCLSVCTYFCTSSCTSLCTDR